MLNVNDAVEEAPYVMEMIKRDKYITVESFEWTATKENSDYCRMVYINVSSVF